MSTLFNQKDFFSRKKFSLFSVSYFVCILLRVILIICCACFNHRQVLINSFSAKIDVSFIQIIALMTWINLNFDSNLFEYFVWKSTTIFFEWMNSLLSIMYRSMNNRFMRFCIEVCCSDIYCSKYRRFQTSFSHLWWSMTTTIVFDQSRNQWRRVSQRNVKDVMYLH